MRITLTTDAGEVLEIIPADEIGDLEKPMGREALIEQIAQQWRIDRATKWENSNGPAPERLRTQARDISGW